MIEKENGRVLERIKIQEKALSDIADRLKRQELSVSGAMEDMAAELKALKVFLARHIPEFKQQFPEIQRKLK